MTARRWAVALAAVALLAGCGWHPGTVPHVPGTTSGSARAT